MKAVILAGGFGSRISEESIYRPKPMIEIGEMPILWHIMKGYSHYGVNQFIICAGYKQHMIKKWFADYFLHTSNVTFDFMNGNQMLVHEKHAEPWRVTIIDTGLHTMTGGRIRRIQKYIENEIFFVTYGDGVSDVNIDALLQYHKSHGRIATITAVKAKQRFGIIEMDEVHTVRAFREKIMDGSRINAGFMVFNPEVFDYIEGDDTVLERDVLEKLAPMGELKAYFHEGFWQCMDNAREKKLLETMWETGKAPWKTWND